MKVSALLLVLAVAPLRAVEPQAPDVPGVPKLPQNDEITNYRLTMEKVRQVVAVQRGLNEVGAKHPELIEQVARDGEAYGDRTPTLKESAADIEKYPAIREVLARAGISAYEFSLAAGAMGNAFFALEIKEGRLNPQAAAPPETAAEKANLALLENNRAEWNKLKQEFMELAESSPWNPE